MTQVCCVTRGPADPTDGSAGAPLSMKNIDGADVVQTSRSSKARQKKFHRHFKQVDIDEKVLNCKFKTALNDTPELPSTFTH